MSTSGNHSCDNCTYFLRGNPSVCNAFHSPSEDSAIVNECGDWMELTSEEVNRQNKGEDRIAVVASTLLSELSDWHRELIGQPIDVQARVDPWRYGIDLARRNSERGELRPDGLNTVTGNSEQPDLDIPLPEGQLTLAQLQRVKRNLLPASTIYSRESIGIEITVEVWSRPVEGCVSINRERFKLIEIENGLRRDRAWQYLGRVIC